MSDAPHSLSSLLRQFSTQKQGPTQPSQLLVERVLNYEVEQLPVELSKIETQIKQLQLTFLDRVFTSQGG